MSKIRPTFVVTSNKSLKGINCPFCDIPITELNTNNGYISQCTNQQCSAYLPIPSSNKKLFCETIDVNKLSNSTQLSLTTRQ